MELLANPWFIIFTVINIIATIYLAIKFYYRYKQNEPTLYEKLINAGIRPTIDPKILKNYRVWMSGMFLFYYLDYSES